jgi:hypothetical protein
LLGVHRRAADRQAGCEHQADGWRARYSFFAVAFDEILALVGHPMLHRDTAF